MKRIVILIPVLLLFFLYSCDEKKAKPKEPPVAAFSVDKTIIEAGQTIYFADESENNPTAWAWNFGDDESTVVQSTSQNPSHTYTTPGVYTVILAVANDDGEHAETKTNYITVNQTTDITFNNPVFTDIHITLDGVTKTIPADGSVTYSDVSGTSVTYSAYTNGATSGGTQVGLKLEWNNTLTLAGGTDTYSLNVGNDYFFIYVRNNGTHVLTPLYVNYGLTAQSYDNIMVPADNVKYRTGYYSAYTNTNVRMYYQDAPTSYVYWNQGVHFTLPWTNNQSVELYNSNKKASIDVNLVQISSDAATLVPELIRKKKSMFDDKAIELYCN